MLLQRVEYNWITKLNWIEARDIKYRKQIIILNILKLYQHKVLMSQKCNFFGGVVMVKSLKVTTLSYLQKHSCNILLDPSKCTFSVHRNIVFWLCYSCNTSCSQLFNDVPSLFHLFNIYMINNVCQAVSFLGILFNSEQNNKLYFPAWIGGDLRKNGYI